MALIIDEAGKRSKADWVNNFTIVAEMLVSVAAKIGTDKLGAANGVATLNVASKVLQTALNAEKIGGLTLVEFVADYTEYIDAAIDALNIGSIDGLTTALNGKQATIIPVAGWSANSGIEVRSTFTVSDWNEATGSKNIEDLAKVVAALIKDLKTKNILTD